MRRRFTSRGSARSLIKAAELSIAAPQVIAMRTARMMAAGHTPGARDRSEFSRMGAEKLEAFTEAWMAMAAQTFKASQHFGQQWGLLAMRPWWLASAADYGKLFGARATTARAQRLALGAFEQAMAPVHKRATANARRLARAKKR